MNIEELKRLAEAATPGPWVKRPYIGGIGCGVEGVFQICHHASESDSAYITAANPAAVLELIRQRDELLAALDAIISLPSHPMRKKSVDIAIAAKAKAEE